MSRDYPSLKRQRRSCPSLKRERSHFAHASGSESRLRFRPCLQILEDRLIPSANVIYGSQFAAMTLFAYDIGTNTRTVLFTGSQPIDGLDVSADQRAIYYSAESAGEVRRYDTMTHTDALIANVTDPADERLTPDGRSLLVSSFSGGVIKKIDLSTNAVSTFLTNPQGGSGPEGMVFDAAGNLYAALGTRSSGPDKYLARIDSAGHIVAQSPGVISLDGLTFNFTDGRIYGTSRLGGLVYRFDPTTLAPTTIASGLNAPNGITTDAAGNLGVAEQGTNSLLQFAAGTHTKSTLATIAAIDDLAPERPSGVHTPPRLTAPADQAGVEGASGNVNLGSFSDPDSSPYYVDINWGDGTAHTTFSQTTAGSLGSRAHIYAEEGTKTATVTVTNSAGQSDSKTFHVAAADALLTDGALTPPRATEGQAFRKVPIFFFLDADANGTASDYTAVINLGDGHSVTLTGTASANGQIVAHAGSGFDVQLSYTYAEELTNRSFGIQVADAGGASIASASVGVSTFVDNTHGLNWPYGLAFDGSGNLYVANTYGNTISEVTPAGAVSTFVDNSHGLNYPYGLAFDRSGNLYVANLGTISKVTPAGAVSTFVDNTHGLSEDVGLAFDRSGNLYVANYGNNTISKVTLAGTVSTFVDNTHGLSGPWGLAFDGSGNLYVANVNDNTISEVTPAGAVSTFVDNTHGLSEPEGLAFDSSGNLYVANYRRSTISKVTPAGVVTTFVDYFHGLSASSGLAFDGSGNLYVANSFGHTFPYGTISEVTPGGFSVADAPLTAEAVTPPSATEGEAFRNVPVFHFSDANANGTASDYTAVVNLGNGHSVTVTGTAGANGQIVANASGGFDVQLSYTYAEELTNQPFNVQVTDAGGASCVNDWGFSTFVIPPLSGPYGLAFDGSGNLYVANGGDNAISKVTPAGAVSTFVDNSHGLNGPYSLAFDGSGNLYVANSGGNTISKVTPAGAVSTFVDNSHGLRGPVALAFDSSGNLYVANSGGNTISKVTPAGTVSTFVDNTHGLNYPYGLAFDGSGNLYVANDGSNTILKVTPAGAVSTFVDNTHGLSGPVALAFDGSGNLYVANYGSFTISKVTPAGAVSTFVDNSHGLYSPAGLAFDGSGNLYVANYYGNTISEVTPAGAVSTFVGDTHGLNGPDSLAFDASGNLYVANDFGNTISEVTPAGIVTTFVDNSHGLNYPSGLAFDSSGNLYVANRFGNTISKVTPAGTVTTFVDDTHGLNGPNGLAFDGSGNLYVANDYANTISKVTPAGVVSTFVDNTHRLSFPSGLAFDGSGNLYVANDGNNTISKVTPAGVVSTFVDNTHRLNYPAGLAFDSSGNLYVANYGNTISKVTPAGVVTIFVDNSHGLNYPVGLAFDASDNLYVANAGSSTISKITPVWVSVADPAVMPAGGFTVTATALSDSGLQTVATFTDGAGEDLADYRARIDWGDGSNASSGTLTFDANSGVFTVQGSHTYADEGSYTITVTLAHDLAPDATVTSLANVVAAAVLPTGDFTVTGVENTDTGMPLVATFIDPHGSEDVSKYAAVINWGGPWQDQTQATIVYDPNRDLFMVLGNYTYPDDGTWTITVTIAHRTALDAVTTSTAVIADAPLEPVSGDTIQAVAGQDTGMVEVATFRDTDPGLFEDASDYGALIDWGDGSQPSLGTPTFDPSLGYWRVTGNHTYAQGGTYTITVTIAHDTAGDITVMGEADVTDAGGTGPAWGARRGAGAPALASRTRAVDEVFLPDQVARLLGDHRLGGSHPAALPSAAGSSASAGMTVSDHSGSPVLERGTDRQAVVSARAARRPAHREGQDRSAPWLRKQDEVDNLDLS